MVTDTRPFQYSLRVPGASTSSSLPLFDTRPTSSTDIGQHEAEPQLGAQALDQCIHVLTDEVRTRNVEATDLQDAPCPTNYQFVCSTHRAISWRRAGFEPAFSTFR